MSHRVYITMNGLEVEVDMFLSDESGDFVGVWTEGPDAGEEVTVTGEFKELAMKLYDQKLDFEYFDTMWDA
jgi:hypothetical protein